MFSYQSSVLCRPVFCNGSDAYPFPLLRVTVANLIPCHFSRHTSGPDSRSRPLFDLCQNLFVASVRSIDLRLTFFFLISLPLRRSLVPDENIKSRCRSRLTDEYLNHCLHLCRSNYVPAFSKLSHDTQRHASTSRQEG